MGVSTNKQNGRSYIVQAALVLVGYSVLSAIVTAKVFSASQLSPFTQFVVCGFLWGTLLLFAIIFRRYYLKLPDA